MFWKRRKADGNLVGSLFDTDAGRINELKLATISTVSCLHEGGHLLVAKLKGLPVKAVRLPSVESFFEGAGPLPSVEIADPGSAAAKFFFHMGGLFGEVSPFTTKDIEGRWEDLIVLTGGAIGDLKKAVETCPDPAMSKDIDNALRASNNGMDRRSLLRRFRFYQLPEFELFRRHRREHMKFASAMYDRWRAADFGNVDLVDLARL